MDTSLPTRFRCPNCGAVYAVVRLEADATTNDRDIACVKCGSPLDGRDGAFLLKYLLVPPYAAHQSAAAEAVIGPS